MTETPPGIRFPIQSFYRSPFAPRIHFDEAGDGGAAAAAAATKPWHDGLDPIVRGHIDNKGWKVDDAKALVTEMAKAWKGLEQHFGAPADQILRLPKDTADEAGWSAVRQRLGMPKEAKEYDFSGVTGLDENLGNTLRNALHKAGTAKDAAPEVAKAVAKHISDIEQAKVSERQAEGQKGRADLKTEWGANFEYNRLTAMQGAKRAAGNDDAAAKLIDGMEQAIGYKATMEFFRKIGAATSEDMFHEGGGGNPVTMAGAKARIAELKTDQEFTKRYLSGEAKAVKEMNDLIALSSGAAA